MTATPYLQSRIAQSQNRINPTLLSFQQWAESLPYCNYDALRTVMRIGRNGDYALCQLQAEYINRA